MTTSRLTQGLSPKQQGHNTLECCHHKLILLCAFLGLFPVLFFDVFMTIVKSLRGFSFLSRPFSDMFYFLMDLIDHQVYHISTVKFFYGHAHTHTFSSYRQFQIVCWLKCALWYTRGDTRSHSTDVKYYFLRQFKLI